MPESRIKLLLVDDHEVVRFGLAGFFSTVPHFSVVGQAGSVAQAVAEARRCRPDVVVMDVLLPDGSGIEACRTIRSETPSTKVLMLTSYSDEPAVVASIMAGASGYMLKQTNLDHLVAAVEAVSAGGSLLDPAISQTVIKWMQRVGTQTQGDTVDALTDQEQHVLQLIAEGKTNREIADRMSLSENTVKTYVSRILRKLDLSRRSEAAAYVARRRPQG
jgi:two-component system, NarL family, response regulator DevR